MKSITISIMKHTAIFTLILFLAGCSNKETSSDESAPEQTDLVTVSDTQRKAIGITLGRMQATVFSGALQVTGEFDVPPQSMRFIAAPLGGFVKSTPLLQGMRVKKGDLLVELQHPDYIQLQQDFLQGASQLEFLEKEFNRQQDLARGNINAVKTLEQAKAQYESMLANVQGLKARLSLLGITEQSVRAHGIQSTVRLYAPLDAYVTEVNINPGKYVAPSDVMIKLVNTDHLHAELQVFEKDVTQLAVGQEVTFQLANESEKRKATIYLIGREISHERTVRVHCHLEKEDENLLPGMFINAVIQTAEDTVNALPAESVVRYQGESYVFVTTANQHQFRLASVKTGAEQNGMTEVKSVDVPPADSLFVTSGSHALLSMLYNLEEEE